MGVGMVDGGAVVWALGGGGGAEEVCAFLAEDMSIGG
jgi:hypothetical protein